MALADSLLTAADRAWFWPTPSTAASEEKVTDSGAGTTVSFRVEVLLLKVLAVTVALPGATAYRRPSSTRSTLSSLTA